MNSYMHLNPFNYLPILHIWYEVVNQFMIYHRVGVNYHRELDVFHRVSAVYHRGLLFIIGRKQLTIELSRFSSE